MDTRHHEHVKRLQKRFDAAHQEGQACLERGDYDGFARALDVERAIIDELDAALLRIRQDLGNLD